MSDNENKKEKTETAAGKESKRESEEKAEDIKYDGNSHVKADAVIQTLSFTGLELNPVVNNSMSLILLAKSISESQHYVETEISEFRTNFINDILSISAKLSTLNKYDEQDITRFRYCLCVFIDEMVMRNPSFMDSFYSSSSLSIRFFKEPSGGNKFFGIMDKWLENPAKHRDMLEFIYVCLILGYQGKFSVEEECEQKLYLLMENIAAAVAPTLHSDETTAFELAYTDNTKETFWSRYGYILKKLTFVIVPVIIILLFYFSNYFILYKNNLEISTYLSNKLEIQDEK